MSEFTSCPNGVKDSIFVPLRTEGNLMVCPLCESEYSKKILYTGTKIGRDKPTYNIKVRPIPSIFHK